MKGFPLERSTTWPVEFAEAIEEGADLNQIKTPFIIFILTQNVKIMQKQLKVVKNENIQGVIKRSIAVNKTMIEAQKSQSGLSEARSAVWSAAESARSAAESVFVLYADKLIELIKNCA